MSDCAFGAEVMWRNVFVWGEPQTLPSLWCALNATVTWSLSYISSLALQSGQVYIAANSVFTAVCLMKVATIPCFISRSALNNWAPVRPRAHFTLKQTRPGTDLVLHPLRVYSSPLHQLSFSSGPVSAPVSPGTAWWWQPCPFSIGATCNVLGHVRAVHGSERRAGLSLQHSDAAVNQSCKLGSNLVHWKSLLHIQLFIHNYLMASTRQRVLMHSPQTVVTLRNCANQDILCSPMQRQAHAHMHTQMYNNGGQQRISET